MNRQSSRVAPREDKARPTPGVHDAQVHDRTARARGLDAQTDLRTAQTDDLGPQVR
jgi:hypothetical protein